ncbi:tetraacyldisaccharide 4'-kinase [Candidatus Omnitrophota bacterium]
MSIIYNIIFILFGIFYIPISLLKNKKREGIPLRFGLYSKELIDKLSEKKNIWIHAVSVGEVMAISSLVLKLREEYPSHRLVITTVTETGNSVAKKLIKKDEVVLYLPFDLSFVVNKVFSYIKPHLLIITETELWPNLIRISGLLRVPTMLVNGRISENSFKRYKHVRLLMRRFLNKIDLFLMQSEADKERILYLGASESKVTISGNLKFDSANLSDISDASQKELKRLLNIEEDEKLLIAGSTHPGEEEMVLSAFDNLRERYPKLKLLIGPRHVERAPDIEKLIKDHGLNSVRISDATNESVIGSRCAVSGSHLDENRKPKTENRNLSITVFILDTIGQLKQFYSIADIVFIGGSLIKRGGQNILEPAALSKAIIFGPYMFNFRDIIEIFKADEAAIEIPDSKSLGGEIARLLDDPSLRKRLGDRARSIVQENRGGVDKTQAAVKEIFSIYPKESISKEDYNFRFFFSDMLTSGVSNIFQFILVVPLWLLSVLYGFIVKLRLFLYKAGVFKVHKLKADVISVGNITWGGTGKTPLVEALCGRLKSQGRDVALLTRGYGGDEDRALQDNLSDIPVIAGKNRLKNALLAQSEGKIDLFILDDGFGHLRIDRRVEILTINATNPFGPKRLLPAGMLREPIKNISRADIIILTKTDLVSGSKLESVKDTIKGVDPSIDIFESTHEPLVFVDSNSKERELEYIREKNICTISGLGDNSSFVDTLKMIGSKVSLSYFFIDHHKYTRDQLNKIIKKCEDSKIRTIVITDKDWVKIRDLKISFSNIEVLVLKIGIKIENEEIFIRRLLSILPG